MNAVGLAPCASPHVPLRPVRRHGSKAPDVRWLVPLGAVVKCRATVKSEYVDAKDPRLMIYRTEALGESELEQLERYKDELRGEALRRLGASERPCCVDVHYSWACLERLHQAMLLGRSITVASVLLPESASDQQVELSKKCSPRVWRLRGNLIAAGLAIEGSRKSFCRFAVAFPVSKELSEMNAPFLVIGDLSSSHTLGQILRTAYHFGVDSVILSQCAWEALDSRAMRVSVGWCYHMDFHLSKDLRETVKQLEARGIKLFAVSETESESAQACEPWALLLACEASHGPVSHIPIPQVSGTLELAHQAAIAVYELSVQREKRRSRPSHRGLDGGRLRIEGGGPGPRAISGATPPSVLKREACSTAYLMVNIYTSDPEREAFATR